MSPLPIVAALLAVLISSRRPGHGLIAAALAWGQALEMLRPELPPEAAWGALLALPALSAWAVRWALLGREGLGLFGAWATVWGLALAAPWSGWWTLALGASVAAQGFAWWTWRERRRNLERLRVALFALREVDVGRDPVEPPSVSERVAIVILAGDAGGLLVGVVAGWSAVGWWAAAVAAVLCVVQVAEVVRWRR